MAHDAPLSQMNADIIIIGAGWAGLTAAVELAPHHRVLVLEASKYLGGRARKAPFQDIWVDNGQHLFIQGYTTLRTVLDKISPHWRSDCHFADCHLQLEDTHLGFKGWPHPWHWLSALFTKRGISNHALYRIGQAIQTTPSPTQTVAEWLGAAPLYQQLLAPVCLAALSTPADIASARVFHAVLEQSFASGRHAQFFIPKINLSDFFPEKARLYIEQHAGHVICHSAAKAIETRPNGFEVRTKTDTHHASQVICATAPWHARTLFAQSIATQGVLVPEFRPQSITTTYAYTHPNHQTKFLTGFHTKPYHWLFDKIGYPGLRAAVYTGPRPDGYENLVLQDLGASQGLTITEKRAAFLATPDIQHQRPTNKTAIAGLYLAGDYTQGPYPSCLEGAVMSGCATARMAIAQLTTQ